MKRVPYWGSTEIRRRLLQRSRQGVLMNGFHALLHKHTHTYIYIYIYIYLYGNKYKYQTHTLTKIHCPEYNYIYIHSEENMMHRKTLRTIRAGPATSGFLELATVHTSILLQKWQQKASGVAGTSTYPSKFQLQILRTRYINTPHTHHTVVSSAGRMKIIVIGLHICIYTHIKHEYWVIRILHIYKQMGQFFKSCLTQDGWVTGEIYVGFIHT